MAQNYTLGRGKIYFAQFVAGTQVPKGERYFGNTPEFALTIQSDNLDHFSSDRGIREKDDSVPLQTNRTGNLTTDHISPENLALFFFGSTSIIAAAGGAVVGEVLADVEPGLFYQLGVSAGVPAGIRDVSLVTVKTGATTFVAGTDYVLEAELGRIEVLPTGAIPAGSDLTVDYTVGAKSRVSVISGGTPIEGTLRFIADNPRGTNFDYFMPWAKISANGDYALKADEWQKIPFSLEVLRKTGLEAIYIDGRPYTPAP